MTKYSYYKWNTKSTIYVHPNKYQPILKLTLQVKVSSLRAEYYGNNSIWIIKKLKLYLNLLCIILLF